MRSETLRRSSNPRIKDVGWFIINRPEYRHLVVTRYVQDSAKLASLLRDFKVGLIEPSNFAALLDKFNNEQLDILIGTKTLVLIQPFWRVKVGKQVAFSSTCALNQAETDHLVSRYYRVGMDQKVQENVLFLG
jgi:hypothetical protein